jgi:hypothetical protein
MGALCPVCAVEHELLCSKFIAAYAAHNNRLEKKFGVVDAAWQMSERVLLLRHARAIALQCADKAEILIALDEMLDAISTPEKVSEPELRKRPTVPAPSS